MVTTREPYDVIIVGGSHAGLSAALTLYRAFHTCVIFDDGMPRDKLSTQSRLTMGWENRNPEECRQATRAELGASDLVEFQPTTVESARKLSDGTFEVVDAKGERWRGRKILLAIGAQEIYPDIDGYASNYGKLIFHCMFCFGHDQRGSPVAGLLAVGTLKDPKHVMINARDAQKYVDRVTIYTNGDSALADKLSGTTPDGIGVDSREVKRLYEIKQGDGIAMEFKGGETEVLAFIVHKPDLRVRAALPNQLGCECVPGVGIKVSPPFNSTNVEGVFAAGDCCSLLRNTPNAMSMGSFAGCGLARELPKNTHVRSNH